MLRALKNQAGDTIVEVLIAIAVISLVLGGAYNSASHSLKNTRQAQEHTVALKFAESQLEQLKSLSSSTSIITVASPFYMAGGTPTGGTVNLTDGVTYRVWIDRTGSAGQYVFTATVDWPSIQNTGLDRVSLAYKVNQ